MKLSRHFVPNAQVAYGPLRELAPDIQAALPDSDGNARRPADEHDLPAPPMVLAFLTPGESFLFHLDEHGRDALVQMLTGGVIVAKQPPPPPAMAIPKGRRR